MSSFDMRRDVPLNPSFFRDHLANTMLRAAHRESRFHTASVE
jgi:hypothetical protein